MYNTDLDVKFLKCIISLMEQLLCLQFEQRDNCHYSSDENTYCMGTKTYTSFTEIKCLAWDCLGVIQRFIISASYLLMLQIQILPTVKSVIRECFENVWYRSDSTPTHFGRERFFNGVS